MRIVETKPRTEATVLPGADFVDAWSVEELPVGSNAPEIARSLFKYKPWWVVSLMALRNLMVAPFRLKRSNPDRASAERGFAFPVISSRPERVVLGMNDKHLDFRLVIDMKPGTAENLTATATTYVRTHGSGGKLYMALIKPFHRRIVPAMLKSAATAA